MLFTCLFNPRHSLLIELFMSSFHLSYLSYAYPRKYWLLVYMARSLLLLVRQHQGDDRNPQRSATNSAVSSASIKENNTRYLSQAVYFYKMAIRNVCSPIYVTYHPSSLTTSSSAPISCVPLVSIS